MRPSASQPPLRRADLGPHHFENGARGTPLEATDAFDVIILGFEPREESPAARLQRAFGIEPEAAARLVSGLPMTVQRAVSRVRAEYFRRALVLLGAEVEVRDPGGQIVVSPEPIVAPAEPPAAVPAPDLSPPPLQLSSPGTAPIASAGWVDPMSRTFAQAMPAVQRPAEAWAAPVAPQSLAPEPRPPAYPTLLEGTFQPPAPAEPARAQPVAVAPAPRQQAPEPMRTGLSSSVWDSGLAGGGSDTEIRAPRDPSSIWDPLPVARPARAKPLADEPAPQIDKGSAVAALLALDLALPPSELELPPEPRPAPASPPASPALRAQALAPSAPLDVSPGAKPPAHFDLTRSIAVGGLWRPLPPVASAITLDDDKGDGARRVFAPWELPNADSMAEPKVLPASRRPPGSASPGTAAAAGGASARPAKAPAPKRAPPPVQAPAAQPSAPTSAMRPAAVGVHTRGATQRSFANADLRSFWETIGEALLVPFKGTGIYWLGAITAWSGFVGVLAFLSRFASIVGWIVQFGAYASLIALACDFYRLCLWTPATGEKALDVAPSFDPQRLLERYIKSGAHLLMFAVASQVPLFAWVVHEAYDKVPPLDIATDPITWLLFFAPYCYWPMAVGVAALSNDFAAIWNVPAGIRTISRAPLEYAAIVLIGIAVFVGTWMGLLLFGRFFGVTGALMAGTIGFPLALSHGIQGALMGHLVRARGEAFE